MIVGLQPSYWQQVAAGLAVIVPTLVVGAFLLGWFARSVLEPRAAGRRWPEGARGVRPIVELVVDIQRVEAMPADRSATEDRLVWSQALRFGLVVAAGAVVPVSTGLVLTQPGLGLYVLAIALALDACIEYLGPPPGGNHGLDAATPDRVQSPAAPDRTARVSLRAGMSALIALAAGVVHAQWGTGSLPAVVAAQAGGSVGGIDVWGLPTFAVHPLVAAIAVAAGFVTIAAMAPAASSRVGALPGLVAQLVDQAWVIAIAAWFVAAFAGGGAVPWSIDNPGTRQVTSVAVFATKTALVTVAFAWARAIWPVVSSRAVRTLLVIGAVAGTASIALTLLVRHLA